MALLPPADVLDEIEQAVAPLRRDWPDLRWVRRDLWHITVSFLGEVDDAAVERLVTRLDRVAGRHHGLELSFAGAGAFPRNGARARVVWTGLYGDLRALTRLAASVTAAGRRAGVGPDDPASFHPHLTLARCQQPTDVRPLVESLTGYAGSTWRADSIHLVQSRLGAEVRYETLRSWPLRPAG